MFRHVVLFKWTEDATEEQKAEVLKRMRELVGLVPELRNYQFGPDAGITPGNFSYAVVADFDSHEDFTVFWEHPAHKALVAECLRPIIAERVSVQYYLP